MQGTRCYCRYREMKMWVYEVLQGEQKGNGRSCMGELRSKQQTIKKMDGSPQLHKWQLFCAVSSRERKREREDRREKIPLAGFVIVRCIGARLCLRLAVPPCVPIRGMLPSYHARGTKRRSTLALAQEPPKRRNNSLPKGNDGRLCFIYEPSC